MTAIFEKELRSYFTGLSGYVFAAFLLLFAGIYTMAINLKSGYAEFEYVLQNMSFIFLIAIPILTMRVVAEERRQKTDQLLYALPVGMTRVVLGKYLAMLVIIALPTVVLGVYPLILSSYGSVSLPLAYGTLLAFFLLAAALGAVGLFLSSLTESQAVAAGLCFAVMLLLYFLSDLADYVSATAFASMIAFVVLLLLLAAVVRLLTGSAAAALGFGVVGEAAILAVYLAASDRFAGLFAKVMGALSLYERFYGFVDGVFDFTAVVYYLTVIGVCLFLTVQSMEKRRWN